MEGQDDGVCEFRLRELTLVDFFGPESGFDRLTGLSISRAEAREMLVGPSNANVRGPNIVFVSHELYHLSLRCI